MGYASLNIGSTSTVKWGMNRLRVALALDNTGSMDDAGKIGALKTATKNLLTQLKTAATTNGDVYVSIIPFSQRRQCRGLGNYIIQPGSAGPRTGDTAAGTTTTARWRSG